MDKTKTGPEIPGYLRLFFPKGAFHFFGAVLGMMLSLGISISMFTALILADFDVKVRATGMLVSLVVFAMMLVHPTFMLTRGKRWAPPFLRRYNAACICLLALGGAFHLYQSDMPEFLSALIGLFFALISFKLYRSRGFAQLFDHYCTLWDAYRERLKADRF